MPPLVSTRADTKKLLQNAMCHQHTHPNVHNECIYGSTYSPFRRGRNAFGWRGCCNVCITYELVADGEKIVEKYYKFFLIGIFLYAYNKKTHTHFTQNTYENKRKTKRREKRRKFRKLNSKCREKTCEKWV